MIRSTLSIGILITVVIWLLLSYLSGTYLSLPQIELTSLFGTTLSRWLLALLISVFVAIQVEVVRATVQKAGKNNASQQPLSLNRASEGFWAFLPLIATLVLVIVYLRF